MSYTYSTKIQYWLAKCHDLDKLKPDPIENVDGSWVDQQNEVQKRPVQISRAKFPDQKDGIAGGTAMRHYKGISNNTPQDSHDRHIRPNLYYFQ